MLYTIIYKVTTLGIVLNVVDYTEGSDPLYNRGSWNGTPMEFQHREAAELVADMINDWLYKASLLKVRVADGNSEDILVENVDMVVIKNGYTEVYTDDDVKNFYQFEGRDTIVKGS